MKYNLLNAIIYEVCLLVTDKRMSWRNNAVVKMIMANCFLDWIEWKTHLTMMSVDAQTESIKETWKEEELNHVVETAKQLYPDAKVTLHNDRGAVLIEHPPDGSKAQELLGGAMEIKSPWTLGAGKTE